MRNYTYPHTSSDNVSRHTTSTFDSWPRHSVICQLLRPNLLIVNNKGFVLVPFRIVQSKALKIHSNGKGSPIIFHKHSYLANVHPKHVKPNKWRVSHIMSKTNTFKMSAYNTFSEPFTAYSYYSRALFNSIRERYVAIDFKTCNEE